jgi:hypothetical protein
MTHHRYKQWRTCNWIQLLGLYVTKSNSCLRVLFYASFPLWNKRRQLKKLHTIFLTVELSSPPIGTSGWVKLGIHCASSWSSSVSLTRSSSKVASPSFRFFPKEKKKDIHYTVTSNQKPKEWQKAWQIVQTIPSSISFWRSDISTFPFILFATAFLSARSRSTSCHLEWQLAFIFFLNILYAHKLHTSHGHHLSSLFRCI